MFDRNETPTETDILILVENENKTALSVLAENENEIESPPLDL